MRQVPLAANPPSPASAAGMPAAGISCHVSPPSSVATMRKRPSTGSLMAMPCIASQNWIASKKEPLRVATNRCDQVRPPSVVRKILEESPMLSTCAMSRDVAAMARKSSAAAPGTVSRVQLAPPSVVRSTVPCIPLAQTTLGETTLKPRSSTSVGLASACHWAPATSTGTTSARATGTQTGMRRRNMFGPGRA